MSGDFPIPYMEKPMEWQPTRHFVHWFLMNGSKTEKTVFTI